MITISTSQIQSQNVDYLTYPSVMADVLAGFSCSRVWWGARAACGGVPTGSDEALKSRLGFRMHMVSGMYGRLIDMNIVYYLLCSQLFRMVHFRGLDYQCL